MKKKLKIVGALFFATLACVTIFALAGCGNTDMDNTTWQVDSAVVAGEKMTAEEFVQTRHQENLPEGSIMVLYFERKSKMYFVTFDKDGKQIGQDEGSYKYDDGQLKISPPPNSTCKVEGDTLTITWTDNNKKDYALTLKKIS